MSQTSATSVALHDGSRVILHDLQMRADGDTWIVGRVDTGEFIAVPAVGYRAVTLLKHHSPAQVRTLLHAETGQDVDVTDFVASLVDVGFVAQIDGRPVPGPHPVRPMLARLRPHHVRWLLHPVTALTAAAVTVVGIAAIVHDPELAPSARDLIWSSSNGLVLLGNVTFVWTLILLHEFAHLLTARAAGAPGRMSLGTRLQFLAAQTDVSGIWAAPRRARITVYLAGITVNLSIYAVTVIVRAFSIVDGTTADVLAAVGLLSLSSIPTQFLVFMRTDVYFVLQDLTGCTNLYADGSAYARHLARRMWRTGVAGDDPSRFLPGRERAAVRAYTLALVAGTIGCLAVEVLITLPALAIVLSSAARTAIIGGSPAQLFDAGVVVVTTALFAVLWTRAWLRQHGHRVHRLIHRARIHS